MMLNIMLCIMTEEMILVKKIIFIILMKPHLYVYPSKMKFRKLDDMVMEEIIDRVPHNVG